MAISGSGGWVPAVRVSVSRRQLRLSRPIHNVPPEVVWHPEDAAAHFVDDPKAYIYVPVRDHGGTAYLIELLEEMGIIDG